MNNEYLYLFKIKKNQIELARDRGYDVSHEEEILFMDVNQFLTFMSEKMVSNDLSDLRATLTQEYRKIDSPQDLLYVYYAVLSGSASLKKDIITSLGDKLQEYRPDGSRITSTIIISNAVLSYDARVKKEDIATATKVYIDTFSEAELNINPTKHTLTPKHELVPADEVENVLESIRANKKWLELIEITDPIVRWYGWKDGDVIKIYRDDSIIDILGPKYFSYRRVYVPHKK